MFKNCELSIAVDRNLKTVVYLDMTFDFEKNLYKRYRKPNNSPIYINKNSNHPPNVLKHLPKSIAKCVSKTLSSEQIFNRPIKIYCKALRRVVSQIISNIHQMKRNRLKIMRKENAKEK